MLSYLSKHKFHFLLFAFYAVLLLIAKYYHEPWRDEYHSLCIALAAHNPIELYELKAYEGHPYLYYLLLYGTQIFGKSLFAFVLIHYIASLLVMYLLLFKFQLNRWIKILLPFNYYFLFEFGSLNRSYVFVILFLIFAVYYFQQQQSKPWLSICCLILAGNFHLQAFPICFTLGTFFIIETYRKKHEITQPFSMFTLLTLGLLASYLSSIPPDDCFNKLTNFIPDFQANTFGMMAKINHGNLTLFPTNLFHFWNISLNLNLVVHIFLFAIFVIGSTIIIQQSIRPFYLIALMGVCYFIMIMNAYGIRHFSFAWITCFIFLLYQPKQTIWPNLIVIAILIPQALSGCISVYKDIKYPFSNIQATATAIKQLHSTKPLAGYLNYTLDALTFEINQPIYFIGNFQLETFTRFKHQTDIAHDDTIKFDLSVEKYLNAYNSGYIILSQIENNKIFKQYLLQHPSWSCQLMYASPQPSIVEDESYEIFSISRKE